MGESRTFKELLRVSFKSDDTEEWLDVHFTRPIGLAFALVWNKLGVHPNVITVLSILLGIAGGAMFLYSDLCHVVVGVVLLMFANFCDSTDGQMARLTGKKTLIGRMLDGFAGDVWFFGVYFAILYRTGSLLYSSIGCWGYLIAFVYCYVASVVFHSKQSTLADYYRQIHLFFLLGRQGSELNTYEEQRKIYESLPKNQWLARAFYYFYSNYCRSQELQTPVFQCFYRRLLECYPNDEDIPQELRKEFREGSLPLMKYTNLLTFNTRAIIIYVVFLLGVPWLYPLMDLTVFAAMHQYMRSKHESLCGRLMERFLS